MFGNIFRKFTTCTKKQEQLAAVERSKKEQLDAIEKSNKFKALEANIFADYNKYNDSLQANWQLEHEKAELLRKNDIEYIEHYQRLKAPAIQGHVFDKLAVHDRAHCRVLRVD